MANLQQRLHVLREGVTIALDSIRSNKVRAGLTILGIAVGVFVVVVISAAVHGINASVAKDLESSGPTTFFVSRFPITFEACDGTDETCKFFRNPRLTLDDVRRYVKPPAAVAAPADVASQAATTTTVPAPMDSAWLRLAGKVHAIRRLLPQAGNPWHDRYEVYFTTDLCGAG